MARWDMSERADALFLFQDMPWKALRLDQQIDPNIYLFPNVRGAAQQLKSVTPTRLMSALSHLAYISQDILTHAGGQARLTPDYQT